jgi:enediyne biosynthesis protein E4
MRKILTFVVCLVSLTASALPAWAQWQGFQPVLAIDSGLSNAGFSLDFRFVTHLHVGGAAAGDVNGNGHTDLVLLRGEYSPRLYINLGNGSFQDRTLASGLGGIEGIVNGAILVDVNGNGALDLLLGGVRLDTNPEAPQTPIRLFLNDGSGQFSEATATSGLRSDSDAHSMALADIDGSGRLDLFVAYWQSVGGTSSGHLWRNLGGGVFEDISESSGVGAGYAEDLFNFTPNFTDLNGNGRPDLLVAADFGHSRVFINQGDGSFVDATGSAISDENGMGATLGDFDNDGLIDWFVTSIWDSEPSPDYGISGNRLYRHLGAGEFDDVTDIAGVREGGWGWASCAADFNNDGWLDLLMVNGYQSHAPKFLNQSARLFINNGEGGFTEQAVALGLESTGQGRALLCFDSNNNGQIDVLIQNSHAISETVILPQLFRNQGHADHHWLRVRLRYPGANTAAVGARLTLEAGGLVQTRELRAGNNYLSSGPIEAHFGLGQNAAIDRLTIRWPDGSLDTHVDLAVDQVHVLEPLGLFRDRFE